MLAAMRCANASRHAASRARLLEDATAQAQARAAARANAAAAAVEAAAGASTTSGGESPVASRGRAPRLDVAPLPVLSTEEYLSKLRQALEGMVRPAAMYNSLVGGIVTDPELMCIPLHDHAIVRGHAVFDTCSVVNGRLYRVDAHLDRHLDSAQKARIPLPFGASPEECKHEMRTIIAQTVVASGLREACVRYYTSVGPGDFAALPYGCRPAFYVVVLASASMLPSEDQQGLHEFTAEVPLKPPFLATLKSNNYMLNALTAMASHERGGHYGILVDSDGYVAESCISNCIFVMPDKRLVTPPFDNILAGTTVKKILELAEPLVQEGLISGISQEQVAAADASDCVEMMLAGGDTHICPVTRWNDCPVGDGEVGPVFKRIVQLVSKHVAHGTEDHYELPYPEAVVAATSS